MTCRHCGKETDDERLVLNDGTVFCCGTCLASYEIRLKDETEDKPELSFM